MKRLLVSLFLIVLVAGCGKSGSEKRIQVVTTMFPLYDFARSVAGDRADVKLLLAPGAESHAYRPSPEDINLIKKCDIFIFTGREMESWVPELIASMAGKGPFVIDGSAVAGKRMLQGSVTDDDREDLNHTGIDPHIWLDFSIDMDIIDTIRAALCSRDPDGTEYYTSNAAVYRTRLAQLDLKYRETVRRCNYRTILYAGHYSLGYLCARYGLKLSSPYRGFAPYPDPTSRSIAELNIKIGLTGINYIFCEEIVEPRVAKIISEETKAKILLFHAGHNLTQKEYDAGMDFVRIMDDNLESLKVGLFYL